MRSMTGALRIAAMTSNSPPQFAQCSMSISNTSLSSRTRLIRDAPGASTRVPRAREHP
jgi:hypothetical protein